MWRETSSHLEQSSHGLLSGRPHVLAVDGQDLVALHQLAVQVHQASFHNVRHEDSSVIPGVDKNKDQRRSAFLQADLNCYFLSTST